MQEEKRRKGPAGRKSTRARGARYEELAAAFLEKQGYVILEKNFFCRTGEIDIIAREGDTLVFVEVKYRKDLAAGDPADRHRKVTDCPRVTVASGLKVVGVVPLVMPCSTAHSTAL